MFDNQCVVVETGCELVIGPDASCDIVVLPPKSRFTCSRIITDRDRNVARLLCNSKGELVLTLLSRSFLVYVNGVQLVAYQQPVRLYPGCNVSFGSCSRQATFRFFTTDTRPKAVPMPRNTRLKRSPEASTEELSESPSLLSSSLLCDKTDQEDLPRSPRVVNVVAPLKPKKKVEKLAVTSDSSALRKCSSQLDSKFKHSFFMHKLSRNLSNEKVESLSPYPIVPYVVELWGQRSILHSVFGENSSNVTEAVQSTGPNQEAAFGSGSLVDPYMTSHGQKFLRAFHHPRLETPVRLAAMSVLEHIEDAYEPQDDIFLQFTEEVKELILKHFLLIAEHAVLTMMTTPLTVRCRSPIVCCGDIHGSFADLKFIVDNVVPFHHWSLMTTPVLFLGDYVDRGMHDVEVMLYLLAWYALCPEYVILLRGNHEDEEVNGDVKNYGEFSFCSKCWKFFGKEGGDMFWRIVNDVFEKLPVMAIIDEKFLACHGGIPLLHDSLYRNKREEEKMDEVFLTDIKFVNNDDIPNEELLHLLMNGSLSELSDLRFRRLMPVADDNKVTAQRRRLVRELLWNDPVASPSLSLSLSACDTPMLRSNVRNDTETSEVWTSQHTKLNEYGFRSNIGRGDDEDIIREFSISALESFMQRWGFTLLIRAHQQKMAGLEMSFAGRIITLFSCCNYTGDTNRAGACIIVNEKVHPVSWRRSVETHTVVDTSRDILKPAAHLNLKSLLPDSVCSSFDSPKAPQQVPSYVGLETLRVG